MDFVSLGSICLVLVAGAWTVHLVIRLCFGSERFARSQSEFGRYVDRYFD